MSETHNDYGPQAMVLATTNWIQVPFHIHQFWENKIRRILTLPYAKRVQGLHKNNNYNLNNMFSNLLNSERKSGKPTFIVICSWRIDLNHGCSINPGNDRHL
jgi:hypothetical protein